MNGGRFFSLLVYGEGLGVFFSSVSILKNGCVGPDNVPAGVEAIAGAVEDVSNRRVLTDQRNHGIRPAEIRIAIRPR